MLYSHSVEISRDIVRKIRVDEYYAIYAQKALSDEERVELLDGTIVKMTPQSSAHAYAIQELTHYFEHALDHRFAVRVQLPLTLSDLSEPEPDIAIVRREETRNTSHPQHALLIVEVASESLTKDKGAKRVLYAYAGIPEYWIVDLNSKTIEVYRDPDDQNGLYRNQKIYATSEMIAPRDLSTQSLTIADLFLS